MSQLTQFLTIVLLLHHVASFDVPPMLTTTPKHGGSNYAVLIAGSCGYYNYRHQADIAHAYQILRKLGTFPASNIVTFMYDDVAWSDSNPFCGSLYNEPGGDDVYNGIHIDYSGEAVNADNFLSVLQGIPIADHPELPVLNMTTQRDNIFVYYSDHGAPGLIAMPTSSPLYATDLHDAFVYMRRHRMYNQLVFYLEACESGSMFDGILDSDLGVFATTAANPDESSFAYYYNDTLGTFMADEYSIRWMQDTQQNWRTASDETLLDQYKHVAGLVKQSSPQKYGDESFEDDTILDFEEYEYEHWSLMKEPLSTSLLLNAKTKTNANAVCGEKRKSVSEIPRVFDAEWRPNAVFMDSRDVKVAMLQNRYLQATNLAEQTFWRFQVEQELMHRNQVDLLFAELMQMLLPGQTELVLPVSTMRTLQWDCLKSTYREFEARCQPFTDYSLKHVKHLVTLCQMVPEGDIVGAFDALCA